MTSQPGLAAGEKLRVAVLGGGFGRYHITNLLAQRDQFEIVRFCDANSEVVKQVLAETGLPASVAGTDYHDALRDPSVHAVIVSLPHHLHEPACVAAAESGKHLLVDKPIARTLEEADRIIEAADRHGVTLMVAHNQRFEARFRRIQEELKAGTLGPVLFAVSNHNQNFSPSPNSLWRSKDSVGGGCVIGSGVHNLDLMRWFFGEASEVFAYGVGNQDRLEAEVAVSASLRFKSGVLVNFVCNWNLHGGHQGDRWGLYGTVSELALDADQLRLGRGGSAVDLEIDTKATIPMWTHFAHCIATRTLPLTNGKDARASLNLVLKIYESMEKGRPVSC